MEGIQPPLDWRDMLAASFEGRLLPYLDVHVSRTRWRERWPVGRTLLHLACQGDNVASVLELIRHGLDVNAGDCDDWSPAHLAAYYGQPRLLEILFAAGARLTAQTSSLHLTPLAVALERVSTNMAGADMLRVDLVANRVPLSMVDESRMFTPGADECVRVLLANGVRLATVDNSYEQRILPWMLALEKGRLCCRAVTVVLMGLKRHRGHVMCKLDRFLVREMALAVFATRSSIMWSSEKAPEDSQHSSRKRCLCIMC